MKPNQQKHQLARSIGSLGGARIWGQFTQFIGFVLAARIVGPEAFGVYALVFLLCALLMLAAGLGWSEYALAHTQYRDEAMMVAQTVGVTVGFLLIFLGWIIDSTARMEQPIFELMLLLGCFIPLRATTSLQFSRLISQRELERLAHVQILSETVALFALVLRRLCFWLGMC